METPKSPALKFSSVNISPRQHTCQKHREVKYCINSSEKAFESQSPVEDGQFPKKFLVQLSLCYITVVLSMQYIKKLFLLTACFSILNSDKTTHSELSDHICHCRCHTKLKIGRESKILLLRRLGRCDLHLPSACTGFAHEAKDRTER